MHAQTEENEQQSFPETADIESSSDDYAGRFAGPAGQWMLHVQESITMKFMADAPESTVLDVGGGHGQLAIPLCNAGYEVTVLGSAESCRKRIAEIVDNGPCRFVVGNVIALPFDDNSFDTVISFRMLTHCRQWPVLVKELCRVARNRVIVDYPTSQSVNCIAPALFGAKKKLEVNTRTWRLFKHHEVIETFANNGYHVSRLKKQFFLPMVLHRMLKCRPLSAAMEGVCRALGLTYLAGSPVIVEMVPRKEM